MKLNKPQIYGTQTKYFITNHVRSPNYIWPIADAENADNRRVEIGLPTIEEYLVILKNAGFKTIWDKNLRSYELLKRFNIQIIQYM